MLACWARKSSPQANGQETPRTSQEIASRHDKHHAFDRLRQNSPRKHHIPLSRTESEGTLPITLPDPAARSIQHTAELWYSSSQSGWFSASRRKSQMNVETFSLQSWKRRRVHILRWMWALWDRFKEALQQKSTKSRKTSSLVDVCKL